MRIRIDRFHGMAPQKAARRLSDYQAFVAQNARLWTEELRPFLSPLPFALLKKSGTIKSIYPVGVNWLEWTEDVDVQPSPIANDTNNRIFYTGDKNPKATNPTLAIAGSVYPDDWFRLGLPAPPTKLTLAITGGASGVKETRAYTYLYRTAWGEKGPPAPAKEFEAAHDDATSWDISAMDVAPLNSIPISALAWASSVATLTSAATDHLLQDGEYVTITAPDINGGGGDFDGANDLLVRGGALTGAADGKKGTFSVWVNMDTYTANFYILLDNTNSPTRFKIYVTSAGAARIEMHDTGATASVELFSTTFAVPLSQWVHIMGSWDGALQTGSLWVDGVQNNTIDSIQDSESDYTQTNWYVGGDDAGAPNADGCIAQLYWNQAEYVDLTVDANREKFYKGGKGVYLGVDGSLPTGTAPIIFLDGDNTNLQTNAGTGGNFTVTGALAACGSNPNIAHPLDAKTLKTTKVDANEFKVDAADSVPYVASLSVAREAPIQTSVMVKEIYRQDANGDYRYVGEVAVATTTYTDTVGDFDLGEYLPDFDWIAPPSDLAGLITLPNGAMAGFSGNQLCLSEPNQPHAWPLKYRFTRDFDIVGIGRYGGQVVVGTKGPPMIAVGSHPAAMAIDDLEINQACISKRSFASQDNGVLFATSNGMVFVGPGVPRLITEPLLERPDWQLYAPSSLLGVTYDDRYLGFFENGGVDKDEDGALVLDPAEPLASFFKLTSFATAAYLDRELDELYLVIDGAIEKFDSHEAQMQTYFESKTFVVPRKVCMTVGKVRWTANSSVSVADAKTAYDAAFDVVDGTLLADGSPPCSGSFAGFYPGQYTVCGGPYVDAINAQQGYPSGVTFELYADGVKVHSESPANSNMFRIPDTYKKADEFQVRLSGRQADIHEVIVCQTPSELALA